MVLPSLFLVLIIENEIVTEKTEQTKQTGYTEYTEQTEEEKIID